MIKMSQSAREKLGSYCKNSYRQRQMSQLDCEISCNCGKKCFLGVEVYVHCEE